jgi:hypothetical protein
MKMWAYKHINTVRLFDLFTRLDCHHPSYVKKIFLYWKILNFNFNVFCDYFLGTLTNAICYNYLA